MSRDASITFDWADGTQTFRLALGQLRELQEKTNAGPMELLRRIDSGSWRIDDLRETIRIGLIGGGMKPADALALVKNYVDARPLQESVFPAQYILMAALFGTEEETLGKEKPAETKPGAEMTASASPASTAQALS